MNTNNLLAPLAIMLSNNGCISIPQVATLFNASEETILDAIEILVFCFDSIDTRLEFSESYARLYSNNHTQTLRLNEHETIALIDALEKFGVNKDDALMNSLIKAKGSFSNNNTLKNIISTTYKNNSEAFSALLAHACDDIDHHLIEIEYQSNNQNKAQKRIVEPYTIVTKDGFLYLQCFLHESGQQRTFRFDRIKNACQLDACFKPRTWINEERTKHIAKIILKAGNKIPEWPSAQVIEQLDDGSKIIQVDWLGSMWLPKQIVAQLGKASVLEPKELKEAVHLYAQQLLNEQDV